MTSWLISGLQFAAGHHSYVKLRGFLRDADPSCSAAGRDVDADERAEGQHPDQRRGFIAVRGRIGSAIRVQPRAGPVTQALTTAGASAVSWPSVSSPAAGAVDAAATFPGGGGRCGFAALMAAMIRAGRRGSSARLGPYGSSAAVMRGALETAVPARGTAGPAIPAGLEAGLDPAAPAS